MIDADKNLPVLVANLIKRMSPQEKAILVSNLDTSTLRDLQKSEATAPFLDPDAFVRVAVDYVSFEISESKITEFLIRLSSLLGATKIMLRWSNNGSDFAKTTSNADFRTTLQNIQKTIADGVVMFEFGPHTLFSTGGGCMLLETSFSNRLKKKIALEFLKLCGYSVKINAQYFSATVINERIQVKQE